MNKNDHSEPILDTALLTKFSTIALELHRLAGDSSIEQFKVSAIVQLLRLVAFDKAWWGRAAVIDGAVESHGSHLFNLPSEYLDDRRSISHDDVATALVTAAPDNAVIIDCAASTPGLKWLGERHGFGEFLCVITTDPKTQLVEHISLYRAPLAPRFTEIEKFLVATLMPHLSAAVSANQIRTLVTKRESLSNSRHLALAVCDAHHTLHCAESAFADLLLAEWPNWTGPNLPEMVSTHGYIGTRLHLDVSAVGELFLLIARSQNPLQQLTSRENDVALRFGEGKTYKEIARELGLSPNTVRYYIRTIYSKLCLKDKASIAHLLHAPPPI
ncbi:UNVERIFIED_ORG: DNA-binding CsgD family transcriptional regulator [Pseudomonas putida]|nr:DNA-binding CsgD family transcriptional regulator [Pseudomonas putida]